MKLTLPLCGALLMGCSVGAFSQNMTTSAADKKFVMDAASGGMAEVKLGQLAQDKGSSDFVKQFGQKMVQDHSKANDELKAVAEKDSITIPADLNAKDQATYDRLSKLSGAAFDSAYTKSMIMDHKKDIADFQKEARSGQNADVKDFASKTLPTLKQHQQMIQTKKIM